MPAIPNAPVQAAPNDRLSLTEGVVRGAQPATTIGGSSCLTCQCTCVADDADALD